MFICNMCIWMWTVINIKRNCTFWKCAIARRRFVLNIRTFEYIYHLGDNCHYFMDVLYSEGRVLNSGLATCSDQSIYICPVRLNYCKIWNCTCESITLYRIKSSLHSLFVCSYLYLHENIQCDKWRECVEETEKTKSILH